jgi:hypothetical protein
MVSQRGRPARRRKDRDDHHLSAKANRAGPQRLAGQFLVELTITGLVLSGEDAGHGQSHAEQPSAEGKLDLTRARAEKPIVADPLEAVGQHVKQEAADELVRVQGHGFLPVMMAVILPVEGDLAVVDVELTR